MLWPDRIIDVDFRCNKYCHLLEKRKFLNRLLICLVALSPFCAMASNTASQSFNKAKKQLLTVYQEHRETLYCGAAFDAKGQVITPPGFCSGIVINNRCL
jgi:thiaminase